MTLTLVASNDPVLHQPAYQVTVFDKELKQLCDALSQKMRESKGIGIAAPQVGISSQIIVVERVDWMELLPPLVMINPKIIESSEYNISINEGCLSFPGQQYNIKRSASITVEYQRTDGESRKIKCTDLMAIVVQHEIDHINGITFDQY